MMIRAFPAPFLAFLLSSALTAQAGLPALPSATDALPTDSSQVLEVEPLVQWDRLYPGEEAGVALRVKIRPGFHINPTRPSLDYLKPTTIRTDAQEGVVVREWSFPATKRAKFAFADQPIEVYEGTVVIRSAVKIGGGLPPGSYPVKVSLGVQACNDANCLRPGTAQIELPVEVAAAGTARVALAGEVFTTAYTGGSGGGGTGPASGGAGDEMTRLAREKGYFSFFLAVFLGGLLLTLTPCVYPMIPITIGYFGGQSEGRVGRTSVLALLYVLGMSVTYSTLGAIAGLTGGMLGAILRHPLTSVFLALVMVALALSQFGLYEFRIPGTSGGAFRARGGLLGALFMGLVVGLVAAPCLGPFVLGILTHVAQAGSWLYGFFVFFVLSLGLGAPFLVLGVASGSLHNLPRAGDWMEWVKKLFGVALLGMAVYFLRLLPVFPRQGRWAVYLVLGALGALYLGFLTASGNSSPRFRVFKRAFAVAGFAVLALLVFPRENSARGLVFAPYSEAAVEAARAEGRPVMIDFSAEWCLPCKEMEEKAFTDPRVVRALDGFVLLRADMTLESDATRALEEKYAIPGVPQVVFLEASGREAAAARVGSYLGPDEFLRKVQAVPRGAN